METALQGLCVFGVAARQNCSHSLITRIVLRDSLTRGHRSAFYRVMSNRAASRIVEIQKALTQGRGDAYSLQREQRELWDKHYPHSSYETIEYDSWAVRRSDVKNP